MTIRPRPIYSLAEKRQPLALLGRHDLVGRRIRCGRTMPPAEKCLAEIDAPSLY